MSNTPDLPPPAGRALSIAMLIVLLTLLTIVLVGGLRWAAGNQLVWGATATPTATPRAPRTATPDFRATQVVENQMAQATYSAEIGFVTPAIELTLTAQTVFVPIVAQAAPELVPEITPAGAGENPTPTAAAVLLPIVSGQDSIPTAPPSPLDQPTPLPGQEQSPLPEGAPLPEATPPPDAPPPSPAMTEEPTPTATLAPPTVEAAPTAPFFVAAALRARIFASDNAPARIYVGPSTIYTNTTTLENNRQIDLTGRTASGEWVYGCCDNDNNSFWIRQADARPTDNDFVPALPTEEPQNDVRWLPTRLPPFELTPFPSPTAIPAGDYPLLRHDPGNQARLTNLPRPALGLLWNPLVAPEALLTPLTVQGNNVIGVSGDRHIYSFDRNGGTQRWRTNIDSVSAYAPALADGYIYLINNDGRLLKLQINNSIVAARALNAPSNGGLNLIDDYLIAPTNGANAQTDQLVLIERETLDQLTAFTTEGGNLQFPAVGDQLVYAADRLVYALDPFQRLTEVWRADTGSPITAPPVYASPGVRAAAELYVADSAGQVISLDANTGAELWRVGTGQQITSMAVDGENLYLAGNGFVRALRRSNYENPWPGTTSVGGVVLSGPIVGPSELLVMTDNGALNYIRKSDGVILEGYDSATRLSAAGVVSAPWIYQPGVDARLYGWRGGE